MKVEFLIAIGMVITGGPVLLSAMIMKMDSDRIFFSYGLANENELYNFINSQAHIARENVTIELAPPHRLVMGHESGTFETIECFRQFEFSRDQQGMMLTFDSPEVLTRAQETILPYMDRQWLFIYMNVIEGPNGSVPAKFNPDKVREQLEKLPKRIQVVLGFTKNEDPLDNSTLGYPTELIRTMWQIFIDSPLIRRRTVAVQMELVHASHSDYLLSQSMSKLQDLLLHALPIVENSSMIDIVKIRRIIQSYGTKRILFDLSDEMRHKLTREEDYGRYLSRGNGWKRWKIEMFLGSFLILLTVI